MNVPRLLIVEEHAPTRAALRQVYTFRGWSVRTADTVASAVDLLDFDPDCVIVDLSVHDGDGAQILEAIAGRFRQPCTIVVAGGADAARLGSVAERFAPAASLPKPVDPRDLDRITEPVRDCVRDGRQAIRRLG